MAGRSLATSHDACPARRSWNLVQRGDQAPKLVKVHMQKAAADNLSRGIRHFLPLVSSAVTFFLFPCIIVRLIIASNLLNTWAACVRKTILSNPYLVWYLCFGRCHHPSISTLLLSLSLATYSSLRSRLVVRK